MKYVKFFLLWVALLFVMVCIFCIDSNNMDGEALKDIFWGISAVISFLLTVFITMVPGYNKVQKMKAKIPALESDVAALSERREHQLEQANKVLDKYLSHENSDCNRKFSCR